MPFMDFIPEGHPAYEENRGRNGFRREFRDFIPDEEPDTNPAPPEDDETPAQHSEGQLTCPLCGKEGLKNVDAHIRKAHPAAVKGEDGIWQLPEEPLQDNPGDPLE